MDRRTSCCALLIIAAAALAACVPSLRANTWVMGFDDPAAVASVTGTGIDDGTNVAISRVELDDLSPGLGALAVERNGAAWDFAWTNDTGSTVDLTRARVALRSRFSSVWRKQTIIVGERGDGVREVAVWLSNGDLYWTRRDGPEVWFDVEAAWRLAPGQVADLGRLFVLRYDPGTESRPEALQAVFDALGLNDNPEVPSWLAGGALYEASAGGHIGSAFSNVGGFANFARQAPYLRDLGVTALWLNAPHEHRTGPHAFHNGWNHYNPLDVLAIEDAFGGEAGLAGLAGAFNDAGIEIISEIVPHGGNSVQGGELEEWWTREPDGTPRRNWNGWGMDYSGPPWVAIQREALAHQFRAFGFRGARIDVTDGNGPNWGSPATNQASFSTLGGGKAMVRAVADAMRDAEGDGPAVIIPETTINRWDYQAAVDDAAVVYYGYPTKMKFDALRTDPGGPADLVEELRSHFDGIRGTVPRTARTLRSTGNHDTINDNGGRADLRFGAGPARAFYAVCAVVPGVPLLYQEEERGHFFAYRRLHIARARIPEFHSPAVDYDAVDAGDARVFAAWRPGAEAAGLGLVNLSGERIVATAQLPDGFAGAAAHDGFDGTAYAVNGDGELEYELESYGALLLRVGAEPVGTVPPRQWDGEPIAFAYNDAEPLASGDGVSAAAGGMAVAAFGPLGPWTYNPAGYWEGPHGRMSAIEKAGGALEVRLWLHPVSDENATVKVHGAREWMVSARSAVLREPTLRRHFPFSAESGINRPADIRWGQEPNRYYNAVFPWGRQWESLRVPLHDDQPSVAFRAPDGRWIEFADIDTTANNVVLTDGTDEGDPAEYALELRFLRADEKLAPGVRQFGINQPWKYETGGTVAQAPALEARFALRVLDEMPDMAERLPYVRPGARMTVDTDERADFFEAVWLVQPGVVRWENLVPVDGGPWRVRLLARHSELAADGTDLADAYVVRINGRTVETTWSDLGLGNTGNAWFGWLDTEAVDLSGGTNVVEITTTRPWAAMRPQELILR